MSNLAMAELTNEELSRLLETERRSLIGFLTLLTGDPHAADDLFQDVCLEGWRARATFEPGTDFGAWIRAVARIQVMRHWRRLKRHRLVSLNPELLEQLSQAWDEESQEARPREQALAECVRSLEAHQIQILTWRYTESWPHERIARQTGRSLDAVRMLLFRLRKALESCMETKLREKHDGSAPA
ncbi:MAG: sigma-70 family RNA polymerase sigma factor [Planctomycetes bacterium]|nr:sigma-70 family RNA polymerase sigma factor [Planctomycetota bacterium]